MFQRLRDALFPGRQPVPIPSDGREIPLRVVHGPQLLDPRSGRPYISNAIRTTRYTLWDFLPKQILYQFSRLANFYFLCMAILQLIPGLSTTGNFTVLIPLLIFVSLTIAKEGYDDFKRHRLDKVENGRSVSVLRPVGPPPSDADNLSGTPMELLNSPSEEDFEWTSTQWQHLQVGDVIKLSRDDDIPADIILLHAEQNAAYIETMALDGETNLKTKQPPSALENCDTPRRIASSNATFTVEDPNQNLYRFDGQVAVDGKVAPLSDLSVIYRGSTLRNTSSAIGLVINTGEETKIRINANRHPRAKRPVLESFINKVVILLALLVLSIASFGFLGYTLWKRGRGGQPWYLHGTTVPFQEIFFGFVIMFNSAVPMSLIMGLEVIKINQMNSINRDLELYHAASDTPVRCNTDTIIDDLGQIGYVFSDKTGTLTENDMRLRKLNIAGTSWAHRCQQTPAGDDEEERTTDDLVEFMRLRPASPFALAARQFLLCLAICHTAQPEARGDDDGQLDFQASSPDELALVKAAQELGFLAVERSAQAITIETADGQRETYEILHVLEFNSDRKRMSVIVRCPDGRIWLICKGADTALAPRIRAGSTSSLERAGSGQFDEMVTGADQLPAKFQGLDACGDDDEAEARRRCFMALDDYARQGLRTLLFCQRFLSEAAYQAWQARYHDAQISLVDRQARVDAVGDEIEQSLELAGASAIEDRLQAGVPETIEQLRKAGIKVWMLTGDKRETAVNIAHSARICSAESTVYELDVDNGTDLETQCLDVLGALQRYEKGSAQTALLVDGNTLHAIQDDSGGGRVQQLFNSIIPAVDSVVCCRASPSQKALLVSAIKDHKPLQRQGNRFLRWLTAPRQPLTLAIGDGANDLSMITTAHIGIGISAGNEGQQAARIADFSIAQFRFLSRLLLVHGRWNYHRTTRFIVASFWKELFHAAPQGLYQCFVGFSGTSVFDPTALVLYGSLFTTCAILSIGSWDRDLRADTLMAVPQLYEYGRAGRGLGWASFLGWVANALGAGLLVIFVSWAGYGSSEAVDDGGLYAFGALVYVMGVVWANVKLMMVEMHGKTAVVLGMFAGTIAALFAFVGVWSVGGPYALTPFAVRHGFSKTFGPDGSWWLTLVVGLLLLCAVELLLKALHRHRLARVIWTRVMPGKDRAELEGGGVWAGFEAWHPFLWQEIEQDPNASACLRSLRPANEVHYPASPVADGERKSKRPKDTAWNQQRLWSWRPILTIKRAIVYFFAISIVAFAIGVMLVVKSRETPEISIDYTDCWKHSPVSSNSTFPPNASTFALIPAARVSKNFKRTNSDATTAAAAWAHSFKQADSRNTTTTAVCSIRFDIESAIPPPVFLYYRLTDFYQSHRDYIKSADAGQLAGAARSAASISGSDCEALDIDPATGKAYYPCGLIANSLFNDTFSQPRRINDSANENENETSTTYYYNMTTKGIAFPADRDLVKQTRYTPEEVVPPPAWRARYPDGYADGVPDLSEDEGFVVWMRTAALPNFRKMAMRNDGETMPVARYQVDVEDNYDVSSFGGTKSIVITTRGNVGSKSSNLEGFCMLVGCVTFIFGVAFAVTGRMKSR
ncbi:phospholipid-translocating P-type ATPase [Lasiodiplodia theobromae]|uniref:Phospholipid-transporting ATPase n=1 Tax=Lasiodiplodia theobromae TaxID=45133 RepID=A0A8H7MCD7_9PEZI|nr:phospholipid-translocating P-type ATPase [Lasiodiplodia theobromae]